MVKKPWHVYIIKCRDKSLYTGITTDVKRRVKEHNNGIGAKSLLGKRPVELVFVESKATQSEARKREAAIKHWTREYKLRLIERFGTGRGLDRKRVYFQN